MPDMKEKLVELLRNMPIPEITVFGQRCGKALVTAEFIADYLIANGVEIPVRCKDCKHYEIHRPKVLENCERNGYLIPMKPDDFCSKGERKDND